MSSVDGISIDKIVHDYGSPAFVVSAPTLRDNIRTFRKEFSKRYPKVEIAYSYKTNCLLGVLDILHKEGAWAEVASGFEYELARKLNVPGESIVFNGPYKKKEELKKASNEGALINVDHVDELNLLEEIASELRRTLNIGVRVNTGVGIHQFPDRFGFNLESGEATQIVRRCSEKGLLRIIGLHIHLTSYVIEPEEAENIIPAKRIRLIWPKSPDTYGMAAKKVVRFAEEIRKKFGLRIKYVDMGGGFPTIDSLPPYVEAIAEPVLDGFKQDFPALILEPGRAIVSNAVHLITTVVGTKELPNGEAGIIVDGGINLLPTSFWRWQEIESVKRLEGTFRRTTIYGPLCLQTDIIGKSELPELKAGDVLIVKSVGAYNISQSTTFIFPRPSILLMENGGSVKVLRRSETVDDILLHEKL
jgi:diaminopimelate decarboxylase